MRLNQFVRLIIGLFLFQSNAVADNTIRVLAWNIESGGSDTEVIIKQLKNEMPKFDILALSEVPSAAIEKISNDLGWKRLGGSRGGEDRLMLAWSDRFVNQQQVELRKLGDVEFPAGNNRSPIFVKLKDKNTGKDFIVMNNHLTRGKEANRNLQADLLTKWIKGVGVPVVAVGDYNMDFDFKTRKGNAAFDIIQEGGYWNWIEPKELVDTNWADPDGDGMDNYPDSMLDFVFVNESAKGLKLQCEVVVRAGDFPDDKTTSDHRPVLTTVHP